MKKYRFLFLFLAVSIFIFNACSSDEADEATNCAENISNVSFSTDITPLLTTYCYFDGDNSCHNGGAPGDFQTYDGVNQALTKIEDRTLTQKNMPPDYSTGPTSLTDCDLERLQVWIDEGAQNN